MRKARLIAALLGIAAYGCNKPPEPQTASHPPAIDLVCPVEPDALTDEQILNDPEGLLEATFNDAVLLAGRACRDALKRSCEWHRDRGAKINCEAIRP